MKIIISHDVDHYQWTDHIFKDLFIQKHLFRSHAHLFGGKITVAEYMRRLLLLTNNRQHRLPEIIRFNQAYNIPSTFFIGMNNGLGLSYNYSNAKKIVRIIKENDPDADIGVHGIAFNEMGAMQEEYEKLDAIISGEFGIRMHYLRKDSTTLEHLSSIGYLFDSTTYELRNPYPVGGMVEFPVSVMDVSVVKGKDFNKIRERTLAVINTALQKDLAYFTVIFHDIYFDKGYSLFADWYTWLVEYFHKQGMQFISFRQAIQEMNQSGI
ncbi:MAG: hypothetical protein H3C48_11200 [Chitinophagaceae bacterium]|nr:hypothetical protein [Chitinophagaceae bacterium]